MCVYRYIFVCVCMCMCVICSLHFREDSQSPDCVRKIRSQREMYQTEKFPSVMASAHKIYIATADKSHLPTPHLQSLLPTGLDTSVRSSRLQHEVF